VVDSLARLAGLPDSATGVMTPGGSMSNLMALMLARDAAASHDGLDVREHGAASLLRPVVLCSELAHFSVQRACAALGLGEGAVVAVPVDEAHRMRTDLLATELARTDRTPAAGTTDHGAVDPLPELAELTAQHGVWLHVDAAYGFGALFSRRLAPLLDGITRADSITLDLHKLGWVPAAASVLLVRDPDAFRATDRTVDYLIPDDDVDAGLAGLLGRSLQTTRRPDCLKVAATLQAYGTDGLGRMVEHCHELARVAARAVEADPRLELVADPRLTTVLFRCVPTREVCRDALQARVRRDLLTSGRALVGRTTVGLDGERRTVLKLTLVNPGTDASDVAALLDLVAETGQRLSAEVGEEVVA
jgi:L-2,4-diaminobutyrate decarboxylase